MDIIKSDKVYAAVKVVLCLQSDLIEGVHSTEVHLETSDHINPTVNVLKFLTILQKQSDLGLHCLSRPFGQTTSVQNFRTFTANIHVTMKIY